MLDLVVKPQGISWRESSLEMLNDFRYSEKFEESTKDWTSFCNNILKIGKFWYERKIK
jgi:hypothetical protein